MVSLSWTKRFTKRIATLGPEERLRAAKSLKQFLDNPRHPSLNFEKLSTGYHTIRVDKNFRIVLKSTGAGNYDVVDVDNHTAIYQQYG